MSEPDPTMKFALARAINKELARLSDRTPTRAGTIDFLALAEVISGFDYGARNPGDVWQAMIGEVLKDATR